MIYLLWFYTFICGLIESMWILIVIGGALSLFIAVFLLACSEEFFSGSMSEGDRRIYKEMAKSIKLYVIFFACFSVINSAIPSKEEAAWIIGGSFAFDIAQTDEAQKLPDNVLRAVNNFLEDSVKEGEQ